MTEPETLQQIDRTYVRARERTLSYFAGCDYYRLATHPRVARALTEGLRKYGLNVAASRMTTGNHVLYKQLEKQLISFFGADDAILVSSGYVTNLVAAQALSGNFSHALIDERSHPSVFDAAKFLDCPILKFEHRSADDLRRAVERCGRESKLVLLTDGLFSRDGSAAPLKEYLAVLPDDALLLVDDSHGAGVIGQTGKGSLEHAGVSRRRIIQSVTLSKAFGAYGGAILTGPDLRQKIFDRSGFFVASTPLPLPLASAALEGVKLVQTDKKMRRRLIANIRYVRSELQHSGLNDNEVPGPIVTFTPSDARDIPRFKRALLADGIYPSLLKYPGGPVGGTFRFAISSEHTRSQLQALVKVLARFSTNGKKQWARNRASTPRSPAMVAG
jgi:7-keto-8-aminopelargonate synthetase-like enzyme